MGKITDKDLYEFVYRANSAQKIATAERWLTEHKSITSPHVFDDLIHTLNVQGKRIFLSKLAESEQNLRCIFDQNKTAFLTDTISGEVIAYA